jgi:hypothetical protein
MSNIVTTNGQSRTLPKIEDLRAEESLELASRDNALNVLLNQPPPDLWLKEHPFIPNYRYIPIERQEWLMTRLFVNWHIEVKSIELIANSICATVRVHYQSPTTGEMIWMDGVGAVPLQTDKGAGATDFNKIKSNGVQLAAPAAKSYAFKDAVETIGNLFGKDINRKTRPDYDTLLGQIPVKVVEPEMMEEV